MKATERPGAAQVTATPRSVTAPRQMNLPSLQDVREAPSGAEQSPFLYQPATSERPSSQETPVTRTSPLEPAASQLLALTPIGASCPGVRRGGRARSSRSCSPSRRRRSRSRPPPSQPRWRARRARSCSAWGAASAPNLAGALEGAGDRGVEHRLGQAAGEGVLLARVVAADQGPAADPGLGLVAEAGPRPRHLGAEPAQRPQRPVPGEGAEGEDRPALAEEGRARAPGTEGSCRARPGSACWRAARSARRRSGRRRSGAGRRRAAPRPAWWPGPPGAGPRRATRPSGRR